MYVVRPRSGDGLAEVETTWGTARIQALASDPVPEPRHAFVEARHVVGCVEYDQDINHRLRGQSGYGGTADMVDRFQRGAEHLGEQRGFSPIGRGPFRIVVHHLDSSLHVAPRNSGSVRTEPRHGQGSVHGRSATDHRFHDLRRIELAEGNAVDGVASEYVLGTRVRREGQLQ